MHILVRLVILGGVIAGLATAGQRGRTYWQERNRPKFRTAEVTEGSITAVVNSTGEVKPVLSISVGSFVSGPIQALHVDFNESVVKGQLMAEIDPRLFEAAVAGDRAVLAIRRGEVKRVQSDLSMAKLDVERAERLQSRGEGYVSKVELDQFRYSLESLEAQVSVAEAGVMQAEAALENAEANLAYTRIVAPVDGIVIDRKIEPGQTLAAQFQTPELFVVSPDIREKMHIFASVDEADIGLIRAASEANQPVEFTVDAYPDMLFQGTIEQIRLSPVVTQNVVTYPVVVSAPNPDQKLMPGMTASLSFQTDQRDRCKRIPNSALRFFPDVKNVRPQDKHLVTGVKEHENENDEEVDDESAQQKTSAAAKRALRYVWVWEEPSLRAIEVTIGVRDSQWTELVTGELKSGDALVVAQER